MRSELRKAVLPAVLAVLMLADSTADAQSAQPIQLIEFNITSQPLAQALNAWAQQSGLQLIWPGGTEAGRSHSRPLHGRYLPMQALDLLLLHSGLEYSVLREGTVTLNIASEDKSTVVSVKTEGE